MDTKTLVVGQDIYMVSGVYLKKGKVVKVTPSGVEVQLALAEGPIRPEGNELIRFDTNGKACDSSDIYRGNMEWNGIPGTLECGPWSWLTSPSRNARCLSKPPDAKFRIGNDCGSTPPSD